jgi:dUTP pyrophosphatase
MIKIETVLLPHATETLPNYATVGSAGIDFQAAVSGPVPILPGKRALIPTGLCLAIPEGFEGQIRSKSGLALKYGIVCLNSPGTIDSDYRGEIKVIVANMSQEQFIVTRGLKIAQIVFARYERAELIVRRRLDETVRGLGSFGSTGR